MKNLNLNKVLYVKWDSFLREDIEFALKDMNIQYDIVNIHVTGYELPENYKHVLREKIDDNIYDFVFTLNFFPEISNLCEKKSLRYISWIYDAPCALLFDKSVLSKFNYIFTFDKVIVNELNEKGVKNVFYAPLAVSGTLLREYNQLETDINKYSSDVSFVGSTYTKMLELYNQCMNAFPDYIRGYIVAVIAAQRKLDGNYIIEDALSDEIVSDIKKIVNIDLGEGYLKSYKSFLSNYIVGAKATAVQRIETFNLISEYFNFDLYTNDPTDELSKKINLKSGVNHDTELIKVYNLSKINLNITMTNIQDGIPLRVFDIMGAGGFLLTNYRPSICELFNDGEEIAVYYDENDLTNKIDYYLSHDEERKEIARRGQEKVRKLFTVKERLKDILSISLPGLCEDEIVKYNDSSDVYRYEIDNPYSVEKNYQYAERCRLDNDYRDALKYYLRAKAICEKRDISIQDISTDTLNSLIDECKSKLSSDEIKLLEKQVEHASNDPFRQIVSQAGDIFTDENGNSAYIGLYNNWTKANCGGAEYPDNYEYEMFPLDEIASGKHIECEGDYILPVVGRQSLEDEINWIRVDEVGTGKSSTFNITKQKSYSYLRLNGNVNIATINPVVFAKPIPLKHTHKKKLVLNLFIDSFNYRIFDLVEGGFKALMPNTYDFFSKGVICTNAYTDSEWTTPSLSSYFTGKYSHKHMNVDENLWWPFKDSDKLLSEYFHDDGYIVCRLGENQESANPSQGYFRGHDRFVCKQGHNDISDYISEAIDQIEAFKDGDQFIWINFEDLHKIAGDFESSISIQANMPICFNEPDNEGVSTVKQGRSHNKQVFFEKELTRMDRYFGMLFDYIKKNYSDDEYVVSLFSDHGTAFLVENDKPMICDQRVHVPMMFYSSEYSGMCDEYVQNVDFAQIMCKLSGIEYDLKDTDSNLPVTFGGSKERDYTYSQTIYIGDPYQAMIKRKDYTYYFKTDATVDKECHIDVKNYSEWAIDNTLQRVEDNEILSINREIILNSISHLIQ